MVNAKHDTHSYESTSTSGESGYQREIFDGNALYDAYLRAKRGSDWKPRVQQFEMNYLFELSQIQKGLERMDYQFHPPSKFLTSERGKIRLIKGEQIHDRIVKHSLCDEVLNPVMQKYLIYDNGASIQGKGIRFTRERLLYHLRHFYATNGSNDGYILLFDFSKYYDNIIHEILLKLFAQYVTDERSLWLLKEAVARSQVDVSYMDEEEYENCLNVLFNSIDYLLVDTEELTGQKFMAKHLDIGDQVAQSSGIAYPMRIDNYIKIVKSVKFYGRYMDDGYVIHESKEFLQQLLSEVVEVAQELGITINTRKTRICKLSERWRFLQTQYSLTETGRVIQKINPKRLTTMRRKMKKLAPKLTEKEFTDWFQSWFKNNYKIMSKQQRTNIETLFYELKEVTKCTQLPSPMAKEFPIWKRMVITSSARPTLTNESSPTPCPA